MGEVDLLLDPQIRLYVVIPVVLITVLVLVGKYYVQLLMVPSAPTLVQVTENQALTRSKILRANGKFLPPKAFHMRQAYFVEPEKGYLIAKKRDEPPQNPMMDPKNMNKMMMGNMTNMVPMVIVGGIINSVFAGFVTIRVPFPLTLRYKPMLQRGIELASLSSSWVSSASFYFICLFGLRGVLNIILGSNMEMDELRMMQPTMGAESQDPGKAFDREREQLLITRHASALDGIETEFLDVPVSIKDKSA